MAAARRVRRDLRAILIGRPADSGERVTGKTFSREDLLNAVGADPGHGDLRSVDVHVTWLREKLEPAGDGAPVLETVRGVGYRLERQPAVNEPLTARERGVDGGVPT